MEETYRYILTLDKVKKQFPKSSWVRITTVTMIAKFEKDIVLKAFRENFKPVKIRSKGSTFKGFEWDMKKTTFYNQVTIFTRDAYSNKSIKLFPNGSVQVAGCSNLLDCRRIARQVQLIVNTVTPGENSLNLDTISVKMINTNFSLNSSVNLNKVIKAFAVTVDQVRQVEDPSNEKFLVTFDPDRYAPVKVKFSPAPGMKRVTASIFSTGKIIVTGAQTLKEIAGAYDIINKVLAPSEVRIADHDKTDSFETILGHKFVEWIQVLEGKGLKPWNL